MRLIIEALEEKESLKYTCSGAVTVFDTNLISLDFREVVNKEFPFKCKLFIYRSNDKLILN